MVTLVGTQSNFIAALEALIELEYDALSAYNKAIDALKDFEYKKQLNIFADDHQRHIQELSDLVISHKKIPPNKPDFFKHLMVNAKVAFAQLGNDKSILGAMLSNEEDTNTAYETICQHEEMWPDAVILLKRNLEDERRHKHWLQSILEN